MSLQEKQSNKKEIPIKGLSDALSMLKIKMEKQTKQFLQFKENLLELEHSSFLNQQLSLAMRIVLILLIIQQIITRINSDGAYDETKRIVFLVFCGVVVIIIKFLKFGFLQKLNWIVNIFAVLILADCFETDENKSTLRVFFNGLAFILCFWIQGQNIILDGACILICFILIHIFKGIDAETALLTIITLPTTLFLKYQHYLKDRQSFLTIELSEFWLEVSQDVSFVQIVAFSFTKSQQKFTFKGSKQSSPQFSTITSDEDLNSLLDLLFVSTIDTAPKYQMKEFQRSTGKTLKSVLLKLFDDSKWSFYAKDNKKYIGTAILEDYEFKFSIRGLNSEDELFILTLGIKDPESLVKQNEQAIISRNILSISLENYEKRFQQLQTNLNQEQSDSTSFLKILQRTMESMNSQTEMLKEVAQGNINKSELDQQILSRKQQNFKFDGKHEEIDYISFQGKSPQTNTLLCMQDQEKFALKDPILQSSKMKDIEDGGNNLKNQLPDQQQYFISSNNFHSEQKEDKDHIISKGNFDDEDQEPKLSQKIIESENILEDKEKKNTQDHQIAKSHFAKEVKWQGEAPGEEGEVELEESVSFFSLRQLIEDVNELYSEDVQVSCSFDNDLMARGKQRKLRAFLISLFENCLHLKIEDQVSTALQFSQSRQQENENNYLLEFTSQEKEFYCYQDKENPGYKNGKSLYQAQTRALRYLNGINLPIVQSLEFEQFMRYLEIVSAKPVVFNQDEKTLKLTVQMIISLDPQRSSSTAADRSGGNNNDNKRVQIQLDDDMTPQENQIFSQYIDDDLKNNESAQHALQVSRNRQFPPNKSNLRQTKSIQKTPSNILSSKSIKISHLMSSKPPDKIVSYNNNNEQDNLIQNLSLHMLSTPQTPENIRPFFNLQPSPIQKKSSNVINLSKVGKEDLKDSKVQVDTNEDVSKNVVSHFKETPSYEDKIKHMTSNPPGLKI